MCPKKYCIYCPLCWTFLKGWYHRIRDYCLLIIIIHCIYYILHCYSQTCPASSCWFLVRVPCTYQKERLDNRHLTQKTSLYTSNLLNPPGGGQGVHLNTSPLDYSHNWQGRFQSMGGLVAWKRLRRFDLEDWEALRGGFQSCASADAAFRESCVLLNWKMFVNYQVDSSWNVFFTRYFWRISKNIPNFFMPHDLIRFGVLGTHFHVIS